MVTYTLHITYYILTYNVDTRDPIGSKSTKIDHYLFVCTEVRCVAEPRDDDKLLCADENTGAKWKGCVNRGSVRIQCPKNNYPCNNMNSNNEFVCSTDCTKHGGKRTTCYADSNGDD